MGTGGEGGGVSLYLPGVCPPGREGLRPAEVGAAAARRRVRSLPWAGRAGAVGAPAGSPWKPAVGRSVRSHSSSPPASAGLLTALN